MGKIDSLKKDTKKILNELYESLNIDKAKRTQVIEDGVMKVGGKFGSLYSDVSDNDIEDLLRQYKIKDSKNPKDKDFARYKIILDRVKEQVPAENDIKSKNKLREKYNKLCDQLAEEGFILENKEDDFRLEEEFNISNLNDCLTKLKEFLNEKFEIPFSQELVIDKVLKFEEVDKEFEKIRSWMKDINERTFWNYYSPFCFIYPQERKIEVGLKVSGINVLFLGEEFPDSLLGALGLKSDDVKEAFVNEQNVCSIVCKDGMSFTVTDLSMIRKNFKNIFNNLDLFYEVYNGYFDEEMFKYIEASYCIKKAKAPDIDFKVYYPEKGHENQSQAIVSAEENSENQFDEYNESNENELRGNNMAYIAMPQGNLDINNIEKNEVENNIPADCIAILTNDNVWCAYDTKDPDNVSADNYMGTLASERGNIPDFPKWINNPSSFKGLRIVDRDKCYLNVYDDKNQKGKWDGLKNRPRRCALYVYLGTSESDPLQRIKIDKKDFIISIVDVYTGENAPIETISSKKQKEKEKNLASKLGFNAIFQKYSYWSVLDVDSHKEIGTIQCVYGTANFFSNYEELSKKLYSGEAYLQFKDRKVHDPIACYCPEDYDDKFRDNIVVKFDTYGIAEGSRMPKDMRKKVIEINTTPLKPAKPVSKEYETPAEEVAPTEKTNKVSSSDESRVFELLNEAFSRDTKYVDAYDKIPVEESEREKKKNPKEMKKELEEKEKEFEALLSRYEAFLDKHNKFLQDVNEFAKGKNVDISQGNPYIDKINKKVLGDSYYKSRWDKEASKVEKSNFLKSGWENQDLNSKTETLKSGIVNFTRDVIMFLPGDKWNKYTEELVSKQEAFLIYSPQEKIEYLDEFNALLGRAIRTVENLQNRLEKEFKQSQKGILSRVSKKLGLNKVKKRLKAVVKRKMEKLETHFPMTPPTIDTSKAKQSTKDKQEFSDKKFNSKKLQKCFKDAAIYILGKTDNGTGKFIHAEFLKKFNSVKSMSGYEAWYNSVNKAINAPNLCKLNELNSVRNAAMGVLLISLSKLLRAKDVISACNGLKEGGFKENAKLKNKDDAMFVWCVSEVRKDVKNKCTGSKETGERLYRFIKQTKELKNLVRTEAIKTVGKVLEIQDSTSEAPAQSSAPLPPPTTPPPGSNSPKLPPPKTPPPGSNSPKLPPPKTPPSGNNSTKLPLLPPPETPPPSGSPSGNSSPEFSPPNFPAPKPPRPSAEKSLPKSPSDPSIRLRAPRPRMPAPGEETVSVRPHLSTSQPVSTPQPRGGAVASTLRKYTKKDRLPPPLLTKGRPLPTPNLTSTRRPRPLSSNSVRDRINKFENKS